MEALISILLVSVLLVGILGAFVVSRFAVDRAKHRMMAMNTIRQYMEQEIKQQRSPSAWVLEGCYYFSVPNGDPITFTIDNNGTPSISSDDLTGTIRADPYPPDLDVGLSYKKIGFVVEWTERQLGGGAMSTSRERAAVYVANHN